MLDYLIVHELVWVEKLHQPSVRFHRWNRLPKRLFRMNMRVINPLLYLLFKRFGDVNHRVVCLMSRLKNGLKILRWKRGNPLSTSKRGSQWLQLRHPKWAYVCTWPYVCSMSARLMPVVSGVCMRLLASFLRAHPTSQTASSVRLCARLHLRAHAHVQTCLEDSRQLQSTLDPLPMADTALEGSKTFYTVPDLSG